jgi:NTP pyrophosphatase (non-canonical NTP hydrolase)
MRFSERNRIRCESPNGFNHALSSWSLSDWMTAVAGEVGEAANVIKKLNRVRDGIPGNKESQAELRVMLAKEIADAAIYLDLLAQAAGLDLETIIEAKFAETSRKIGYIGDGRDVNGNPLTGKELASDLSDGVSR